MRLSRKKIIIFVALFIIYRAVCCFINSERSAALRAENELYISRMPFIVYEQLPSIL